MVEVKALYHFLDKKASRNRIQGDVFYVTEEYAEELERRGLVVRTKVLPIMNDIEKLKGEKAENKDEPEPKPAEKLTKPSAKNIKVKDKKK